MLGIMLVTLPVVYVGTSFLAWWLLSLTRRWLLAIVATLALFAWSHLIGTASGRRPACRANAANAAHADRA